MAQLQNVELLFKELKTELCFTIIQLQNRCSELTITHKATENELSQQRIQIEVLQKEIVTLREENKKCINQIIGHQLHFQNHEKRLASFESHSALKVESENLLNNIIIHGLEMAVISPCTLQNFFEETLNINPQIKSVKILETKKPHPYKPIIISFQTKEDKKLVFANCHLLKSHPKKISIWDDIPSHQRQIRKLAVAKIKKAAESGIQLKVKGCKVVGNRTKPVFEGHKTKAITSKNSPNPELKPMAKPVFAHSSNKENVRTATIAYGQENQVQTNGNLIQAVRQFKTNNFLQIAIGRLRHYKLNRFNAGGKIFSGLLARTIIKCREVREKKACSCNVKTELTEYHTYLKLKGTDLNLAQNLFEEIDRNKRNICKYFIRNYKETYKLEKSDCFCQIICVEELLLDDEFFKTCKNNTAISIERCLSGDRFRELDDNMLQLLFE